MAVITELFAAIKAAVCAAIAAIIAAEEAVDAVSILTPRAIKSAVMDIPSAAMPASIATVCSPISNSSTSI